MTSYDCCHCCLKVTYYDYYDLTDLTSLCYFMLPFATAGIQLQLLDSLLAESGGRFSGDGLKMSEIRQNHWAFVSFCASNGASLGMSGLISGGTGNMERWSPIASQDQFAIVSRYFCSDCSRSKGFSMILTSGELLMLHKIS